MALRIYDTKSRSKKEFIPRDPAQVNMYVCGPTVYGPAHLGHARSYIMFDVVRRYLEFKGHKVRYVQNITDIEDSITRAAKEKGVTPLELASKNAESFIKDMDGLGIKRSDVSPRVTEHIREIIETVQALIDRGYAYVSNGNVFFRTSKAKSLGCLSHRNLKEMLVDSIQTTEGREQPLDFALWRKSVGGHPCWPSPWGEGRPGWHVECFAMSTKHLGMHLDLHCGGVDLIYPHHENSAMISEAFVGDDWCNFWLHNGFITIEQEKMSKSLGNFVTVRSVLDEYSGDIIRLCLLKAHYRDNVEYDRECFARTRDELERIQEAMRIAKKAEGESNKVKVEVLLKSTRERFHKAMDDDFDTPKAVDVLMQFTEAVHEIDHLSSDEGKALLAMFEEAGRVLGLFGAT